MTGAKHALQYCQETRHESLYLCPGADKNLKIHVDADQGTDQKNNRRTRIGIHIQYGNAPIYANSTLQKYVALSCTVDEYIVLSEACKVVLWLRRVLEKLGMPEQNTQFAQDNLGTIYQADAGPG